MWTPRGEYPYASGGTVNRGTIVYAEYSFYHIAGKSKNKDQTVIGRLNESDWRWNNAGDLINARYGHNAIYVPSEGIMVIGGSVKGQPIPLKTEICTILGENLFCREQNPALENYLMYPELFIVPDNFCHNGL